jgi:four helix bundle protein
VQRSSNH